MEEPAHAAQIPSSPTESQPQARKAPVGLIIAAILVLALVITSAVLLLNSSNDTTARVRDVFIIFMALESLVIGVALVILIVQLATLINLLNNEIRPIIRSTNDTVNTLKGTIVFLSDNLSEPVIKLNESIAAIRKFFDIIRPGRS
jgi:predicted PurR-regulated permease PerM